VPPKRGVINVEASGCSVRGVRPDPCRPWLGPMVLLSPPWPSIARRWHPWAGWNAGGTEGRQTAGPWGGLVTNIEATVALNANRRVGFWYLAAGGRSTHSSDNTDLLPKDHRPSLLREIPEIFPRLHIAEPFMFGKWSVYYPNDRRVRPGLRCKHARYADRSNSVGGVVVFWAHPLPIPCSNRARLFGHRCPQ